MDPNRIPPPAAQYRHVGGSFAPPLSDSKLAAYREMAKDVHPQIADAMNALLACVEKWWELPDSTAAGSAHPSGRGTIIPLDKSAILSLDEHIPWGDELDLYAQLFEGIDPVAQKELRDAAHHLLWHVRELESGREPLTSDLL